MYKIPENFNVLVLKDEVINQITFGSNFITLFFNEGFIQFTGGFSFNNKGQANTYEEVYPVKSDFGLLQILEKKIISVSLNKNRDVLNIKFEDMCELTLIGTEFYESFIISINGNEIRV